jgi:dienelactone hydrolase
VKRLGIVCCWLCWLVVRQGALAQELPPAGDPPRRGEVEYRPPPDEGGVPEMFRLPAHRFAYQQTRLETAARRIEIFEVTFPSPVHTPYENNNTVYTEYFRPLGEGPYPGVIVLHILGGDFDLSRFCCRTFAHHGICALFVKMPYYGPRRAEGAGPQMISMDPESTVANMRQAILDIRRATAWLAAQGEVDAQRLGVFGISLGGITGSLAAAMEPRLQNVCLLLAGGDIGRVAHHAPEMAPLRARWLAAGYTPQRLVEVLRPIDPVTYGANVRGRRIVMFNARYDEVIPSACSEALWESLGRPEIVWFDCGHYSAARFFLDVLAHSTRFFQEAGLRSPP